MGVRLSRNHIEIAEDSFDNGIISRIGYKDVNDAWVQTITENPEIKVIQISEKLPFEAYEVIDSVLERKKELIFRIYGLHNQQYFDISFLKKMPHLQHLRIDCHLRDTPNLIDFDIVKTLPLKSLYLDAFDLHDYSFLQCLCDDIEEITINADTMGKAIKFDCNWFLPYKKLNTLWLGKKAKRNIESLSEISSLKNLSLRGIKLSDFAFLKELNLEKFELLWNSNSELSELKDLKTLKQIGLWRIHNLENIDFISELVNLEVIKLQDLKHLRVLPDFSKLTHLNTIVLDNTGVKIEELAPSIQQIVKRYWN